MGVDYSERSFAFSAQAIVKGNKKIIPGIALVPEDCVRRNDLIIPSFHYSFVMTIHGDMFPAECEVNKQANVHLLDQYVNKSTNLLMQKMHRLLKGSKFLSDLT